jgi:hypothetical protein
MARATAAATRLPLCPPCGTFNQASKTCVGFVDCGFFQSEGAIGDPELAKGSVMHTIVPDYQHNEPLTIARP